MKEMLGLKTIISLSQSVFYQTLIKFYGSMYLYIYRAQGNNWALVQWAYQSKREDKTIDPYPVNIKPSHK